jgi:hypothetical protein
MKQLLFLLLFPCFAMAQYQGNAGQKITLGEQTTADGIIWRGVSSDTTLTVKSDTAAYFVLDTVNINLYTYKASATGRKWRQLGADTASIAYVNTYGTQTVNGAKTFSSTITGARFDPTSSSATGNGMYLPASNTIAFSTADTRRMTITSIGLVGINTSSPSQQLTVNGNISTGNLLIENTGTSVNFGAINNGYFALLSGVGAEAMRITTSQTIGIGTATPQSGYRLHVVDSVYVGGNVSASAYTTRSDFNLKDDIFDLKYGLNDVLKLQPVEYTYKSNGSKQLGFIAQDIGTILPEVVSFEESMSVNYQAIIPILTKAIQEQQAQIEALKQRLLILENK